MAQVTANDLLNELMASLNKATLPGGGFDPAVIESMKQRVKEATKTRVTFEVEKGEVAKDGTKEPDRFALKGLKKGPPSKFTRSELDFLTGEEFRTLWVEYRDGYDKANAPAASA